MTIFVTQDTINAFFDGRHADPFAVLGMHETDNGIEVRALLPDAGQVVVIDKETQDEVCELSRIDERGFFAGVMPQRDSFFNYQLQVSWGQDVTDN